jgi:hypothetical protein
VFPLLSAVYLLEAGGDIEYVADLWDIRTSSTPTFIPRLPLHCDTRSFEIRSIFEVRKQIMNKSIYKIGALSFLTFLLLTSFPRKSSGAVTVEPTIDMPIPYILRENYNKEFKSWSLFLICNPTWLLKENNQKILELYEKFGAFGRAIGEENVAVWFWKKLPTDKNRVSDFIDENNNSNYCRKFNLRPSESPHILVTTIYPDLDKEYKPNNYLSVKLHKMEPKNIIITIEKLTDQILLRHINKADTDSESYWNSWKESFDSIKRILNNVGKKITVTIDAKFLNVEIYGGKN